MTTVSLVNIHHLIGTQNEGNINEFFLWWELRIDALSNSHVWHEAEPIILIMLHSHSWPLLILEPEVARVAANPASFAVSLFASFSSVSAAQCSDSMFYTFQNDHKISLPTICQHTEILHNYWLHSLSISFSWLTAFVSLWLTYFVTDSWCQFSLLHLFLFCPHPTPSGNYLFSASTTLVSILFVHLVLGSHTEVVQGGVGLSLSNFT